MSSNKRNATEMGASSDKRQKTSGDTSEIGCLFFLLFTVASCGGLCQGCDQCNPKECEPEKANAIRKGGVLYKQIGRELKRTFASLTCLFIRVQNDFTRYYTPTAEPDYEGRLTVKLSDDNGKTLRSQALKFASLAWGQVIADCVLPDNFRDFGNDFHVDHIDGDKTNNNVSNGMIMSRPQHQAKTIQTQETIAKMARNGSSPCTMTVYESEGNVLTDSEGNPEVINFYYRYDVMKEYGLTKSDISHSIDRKDTTMKSLFVITYKGQERLAQFSIFKLPNLEGEIWEDITEANRKLLKYKKPKTKQYKVSNMGRVKSITTRSGLEKMIISTQDRDYPSLRLNGKHLYLHRVVALVFCKDQMEKKILEKGEEYFKETRKALTFSTLIVDHIDKNNRNSFASNLQFLTQRENVDRAISLPCRFWKEGERSKSEYASLAVAARKTGLHATTLIRIIQDQPTRTKNLWHGEYL